MVERDFADDGSMLPMSRADKARVKGHLPFYSVDTREEADALTQLAIEEGEFVQQHDGTLIEVTLVRQQTPARLALAGEHLAVLHERLRT